LIVVFISLTQMKKGTFMSPVLYTSWRKDKQFISFFQDFDIRACFIGYLYSIPWEVSPTIETKKREMQATTFSIYPKINK